MGGFVCAFAFAGANVFVGAFVFVGADVATDGFVGGFALGFAFAVKSGDKMNACIKRAGFGRSWSWSWSGSIRTKVKP